jgi:hypothetical protein
MIDSAGTGGGGLVLELLVARVRVHSGDEAALDVERVGEHLGERGQAVGGARGVRNDSVRRGVERVVVHAHANGDVGVGGRRRNDDALGAALKVRARFLA